MGKTKLVVVGGLVMVLVAALLVGSACAAPAPVGAKVIKIGAPGALSGMAAPWGLPEDRGLRMQVDEVNAAGGLTVGGETYTFVVISGDTKFSVEGAAAVSHRLVTVDKVKYAVGGIDKHETLTLQSTFEPAGVIHFHDGWGSGIVHPEAPHSFRTPPAPQTFTPAVLSYILQAYPEATRWGLVGYDTPGIHECSANVTPYFGTIGLEIAAEEYYAFDTVEFYPLITKLMDAGVNALYVTGATPPQAGLLLKQAREKGYTGLFFFPAPLSAKDIVGISGVEAAEGAISLMAITSGDLATPEARAFRQAYIDSYGQWESNVVDISVGFQIILEAMKEADSIEVEKVLPVLHAGGPFDTLLGPVLIGGEELFGTPNECFIPLAPHVIRNGESVPEALLTAEYQVEMLLKYLPK